MAEKNLSVDWKKWYQDHLTDVEGAAQFIKDGDCIWMGQASEIPYSLLNYLNAHKEDYHIPPCKNWEFVILVLE